MLDNQIQLDSSPYSSLYDIVVPKNHFLRHLTELCAFSFIYVELEKHYYVDFGRKAYSPIMIFMYLLLKDCFEYNKASGLFKMGSQAPTTIFVFNLNRNMIIIDQKEE